MLLTPEQRSPGETGTNILCKNYVVGHRNAKLTDLLTHHCGSVH